MTDERHAALMLAASEEILLLIEPRTLEIVAANAHAARSLGYRSEELCGRPVTDLERALQDAFYWDDVSGGRIAEIDGAEGLLACADGRLLPVVKSVRVVDGGDGPMLALRACEAGAAAATADELDATTSLLRSIFESTAEGLLVLELDGRIMNFNHRFAELWRLDGMNVPDDAFVVRRMVRQCRRAKSGRSPWRALLSPEHDEVAAQLDLRDGRSIRIRARPLLMQEQLRGRVLTCSDITERITHERELAAARDAAAASERAKASFLAMMSHEIRTPLAGILGMTEIALDYATNAEQRRFIEMAHASADGLLAIINDLLDFSKIEAGKFLIEAIPFDPVRLLEDALQPLVWQAGNRGLKLELDRPGDIPPLVVGDPTRVRQILINLVGNGLKFTERGGVTVAVETAERSGDEVRLRISVRDTGIGIPAERLRSIFQAFTQSDAAISRRFGGTGLGLTICARLCELMDGRIWVESAPGQGSTFFFELPLRVANADEAAAVRLPPRPVDGRRLEVLVAEDTEVNQVFLRHALERAGHRVTLVDNGRAAVEAALARHFDAILMDVQMPLMDGFEATDRLRAAGVAVPVVGLTAHALEGIREECLAHGMSDYLSKPVQSSTLLEMVARLAGSAAEGAAARDAGPAADSPRAIEAAPGESPLAREQAVANLGGDTALWMEMLSMLWEQADVDLAQMREAAASGDLATVRLAAHRLKSSLAVVGALPCAASCAEVEQRSRREDREGVSSALAELLARFQALREVAARLPA